MDIPEILTMVIRNLSRRQQAISCLLVSRFWYQYTLPLVYERVDVDNVFGELVPPLNVIMSHNYLIRVLSVLNFSQELQDFVTEASNDIREAALAMNQGQAGVAPLDALALFPQVQRLTFDSVPVDIPSIGVFVDNCPNLRELNARWVLQQAQQGTHWMTSRCPRLCEVEIHIRPMSQMTDLQLAGAVEPSLCRFRVQGHASIGSNTFSALQATFANLERVDFFRCTGTPAAVAKPILLHCPQLAHFLTYRFRVDSFYEDAAGVMLGDALVVAPHVTLERSRFRNWLSTRLVTFQVHHLYWSDNVLRNNTIKNQLLRQNILRHLQMDRLHGSVGMSDREMMPGERWPRSSNEIPILLPWMNQHWPNLTTFRHARFSLWVPNPNNVIM